VFRCDDPGTGKKAGKLAMTVQRSKGSLLFAGFWWRLSLRIAVIGALVGAANLLLFFQTPHAVNIADSNGGTIWSITLILVLYVLLLSVPFVPAAEIGLALLVGFGAAIAWPVYVATVLALSIAFAAGRIASRSRHARTACAADPASEALARLGAGWTGRRRLQRLLRFRWLAIAVLINLPGNTIVGGGGGIAMAVGYSRTFNYPAFLACSAVAVAPVPVMVLLAEYFGLGNWFGLWTSGFSVAPTVAAQHQ